MGPRQKTDEEGGGEDKAGKCPRQGSWSNAQSQRYRGSGLRQEGLQDVRSENGVSVRGTSGGVGGSGDSEPGESAGPCRATLSGNEI